MNKNVLSLATLLGAILGIIIAFLGSYLFPHIGWLWKVALIVAFLSTLGYAYVERMALKHRLAQKSTRYGMNSLFMSFVALLILIAVNLIVTEHDIKKDFTKNKLHTLSDQSIKLLKGLKQEIRVLAFVLPTQVQQFENVFNKYSYYSDKLKKEFVDLDRDILKVQKYGVKQAGTIVVETDSRNSRIENLFGADDPKMEERMTNAIIQVTKGGKRKLYYISGHGERLLSDAGKDGYSTMKDNIEGGRYQVEELVLLQKNTVPADADIVLVAGPKSDFMESELKTLDQYVRSGGKLMVLVDPLSSPALKGFLAKFGADWKPKKTVYEANQLQQLAGGNPLTPIVVQYDPSHEITREAKQLSIFPVPSPVEKTKEAPKDMTVTSLFSTSRNSLEVDLAGDKVKVNEKTDRRGPLSLALAISGKVDLGAKKEAPKPDADPSKAEPKAPDNEFRVIVVGNSAFPANGVSRFGINSDLFQNMLSWLSKEEDLIAIRPRSTDTSEFEITEERSRVIFLSSVLFAPFAMFISGIAMWMKRRKL